ncbi:hypothetical protein J7I44_12210 [Frateuria sp. MAH-13]|uniref:Uncharacterized protein n=1 Tax=Frateuria flava TaxID=2821489 RepID=A0ABS4DPS7_9GAMM|nr:hypothetical protein [Frateuria flava]MBP1475068.1 hypothetical protein [Frateuria flava]
MFDAIDFLEQIGKDASLRYRRAEQLDDAASRARVDMGEWKALTAHPSAPMQCAQVPSVGVAVSRAFIGLQIVGVEPPEEVDGGSLH